MKKILKIKAIIALLLVATSMVGCSTQKRTFIPRVTAEVVSEGRSLAQANDNVCDVKTVAENINSGNYSEQNANLPTSVFNIEKQNSINDICSVGANYNNANTATVPTVIPTGNSDLPASDIVTMDFAYKTPDEQSYSKALPISDNNCEHNWTYTNKTIHHDAETHTETVTINEPWDEKVIVKAALDEKVITKNAWDEKKLVRDEWDERVLIKASYNETINNGYSFVETVWLQGCDGNAAALGYSSPYDYLRDYYSDEDKYYLEYDSGYKTYPEAHFVHTYSEASNLMNTNRNVRGFVSGAWYNVYVYNSYNIQHEAEYKTVHHNAEYETIHHDAEYKIVHHDAEYKTIHHDTKCENKTIVDKPAYDTYQTIFTCSKCQKTY